MNAASAPVTLAPAQPGQHVDGERQDLERDEDDQQVDGGGHHHHAADGEQRQRVVLAGRQLLPLDHVVREQHRQHADDAERDVDEEREIVGADDAEAAAVGAPEEHRGDGGAGEADQAEPGNRHALARLAEGFREHRGGPGQRDDQQRNDGGVISHGSCRKPVTRRSLMDTLTWSRRVRRRCRRLHLRGLAVGDPLDDAVDRRLPSAAGTGSDTRP